MPYFFFEPAPSRLLKETLNFRCNKTQITGLKKFHSKYSLNFSYIVLKSSLSKLKTMSEIQCIIGLNIFFRSDLTSVASEFKILFL